MVIACLTACSKPNDDPEQGIVVGNKEMQMYLLSFYDKNRDGILSKEEALSVTEISIPCSTGPVKIVDGLEHFPNLEILSISSCDNQYSSLDVSANQKLRELYISWNKLKTLDLTRNPELERIYCGNSELEFLNLGYKPKLIELGCVGKLNTLDLSGCYNLITLSCRNNQLIELDVSNNPNLEWLDCGNNKFETIDVSNNLKLKILNCSGSSLLKSLDLSKNQELFELSIDGNILMTEIDVSKNSKLESLLCRGVSTAAIDVSNNLLLWQLFCSRNPNLATVYLKAEQSIQRLDKDVHTEIVYK